MRISDWSSDVCSSDLGKDVRVGVFARGAKAEEALAAGAEVVGAEDLLEIVQGGKIDFDRCIATPDMMGLVGRLGKVLGPKGLMPNQKLGTDRKSVVLGKSVSVRVDLGGRRIIKKKRYHYVYILVYSDL